MRELESEYNSSVIIKIPHKNKKSTIIIGSYRQWKSVGSSLPFNSDSIHDQTFRLNQLISSYQKATDSGSSIIIGGDINIDRHLPNDPLERNDLKVLYPILDDFITINNMTQVNWSPTRHRIGQKSTLLDIFISNCPGKINGVTYVPNSLSEHEGVLMTLHNEDIQIQPQFFSRCCYKKVIWNNLEPLITNSNILNSVFSSRDPDYITNSLLDETNRFMDLLAPITQHQRTKKSKDGLNNEIRNFKLKMNVQITKAIKSKDPDEFRKSKHLKNTYKKMIDRHKREKFNTGFLKNKWKTIKDFEAKEAVFPTRVKIKGKLSASPKLIAEEFATFFFNKIKSIREEVNSGHTGSTPMDILSFTLPSHQSKQCTQGDNIKSDFSFQKVTISQVYKVINESKKTNSTGHDRLSMRTINEMPQVMAIFITHLFNTIIDSRKFPESLKITKIFPLKKQGKDSLETSSYRPIANLSVVEKIVEELMKRQIDDFFEEAGTIPKEHHGGRKHHSTATAKTIIDYNAGKAIEEKKTACMITTDLTAAYDTVDHGILIQKLQHHGFSDQAAEILKSFLGDRQYFVEVEAQ